MTEQLLQVEIKKVIGPTSTGSAAVLLGNERKTFVIFIGFYEAAAMLREIKNEPTARPLTHDLLQSVFLGFDLSIKKIIVSDIIDNAFCATLILEQNAQNGGGTGLRNEVRIDARPSDCLVLALKNEAEIFVTEAVFEQVQDFSDLVEQDPASFGALFQGEMDEDVLSVRPEGLPTDLPDVTPGKKTREEPESDESEPNPSDPEDREENDSD